MDRWDHERHGHHQLLRLDDDQRDRCEGADGRARARQQRHHHLDQRGGRQPGSDPDRRRGCAINNCGTWLDQTSADIPMRNDLGGAVATLNNTGTYTKSGASTATVGIAFNNTTCGPGTGVLTVNAGTLTLTGGGTSNGKFDVASGATLNFAGGTHDLSGTIAGSGTGQMLVSGSATVNTSGSNAFGGQVAVSAGTLNAGGTFSTGGFALSGGTLGGTGSLNASGSSSWTGGIMSGTGTTSSSGSLAISGTTARTLTGGHVLANSGTVTWTNAASGNQGLIQSGQGSAINNSGIWLDQTSADIQITSNLGGALANFNNTGTYTKSGASTATIGMAFNNTTSGPGTGVVTVNAGTLALTGGGTSNGKFDVASGATLNFAGGTHDLSGTIAGSGTGQMLVSGSATVNTSGSNAFGGQVAVSAGTLNAGGTFSTGGFALSGGTLGGTGSLNASGSSSWTGGTMSGTGTTSSSGSLAMGRDRSKNADRRARAGQQRHGHLDQRGKRQPGSDPVRPRLCHQQLRHLARPD